MQVLLDVWEGSLDIDEVLLREAGVSGLMIRLNDINAGHHLDENFKTQWMQSAQFLRAPYFVYSPWYSGLENAEWLKSNLPCDVTRIFADIEVKKLNYSPDEYADEVVTFFTAIRQDYPLTIPYTAQWFLPYLSHWVGGDYWWARYPFTFYPAQKESWTWEKLCHTLNTYGYQPDPLKKCPGVPRLWQLSGDRLILPGCANRPIDVNAFNGTVAELETWWGAKIPSPPLSRLDILWREAKEHGWYLEE